jgi:hypothetical protein
MLPRRLIRTYNPLKGLNNVNHFQQLEVEIDEDYCDGDFPDLLGDLLDDACRLSYAEMKGCNGLMDLARTYGMDYDEDLFYIEEFDAANRKSKFTFFPARRASIIGV